MDTNGLNTGDDKKKRKRNKQLLKSIRQQVEFYFSDANLRKDRFLKQALSCSEDRYVDVSTIASFNRMKVLCPDPSLIPQALSASELLELSDDKTKIRRKTPLGEPEYDPDDVTVYVECLPKTVDHDWLRKVFGVCGSVEYVSLPRYRSTGDAKGFAFIEFKTPEEANRACEMLNNPPEEDTGKLGRFPKTKGRRYVQIDDNKDEKDSNQEQDEKTSSKKRSHDEDDNNKQGSEKRHKRRHRESESSDGKPDRHKRKRQHSNDEGKTARQESGGKQSKKDESNVDGGKEVESKEGKKRDSGELHKKEVKDDCSEERGEREKKHKMLNKSQDDKETRDDIESQDSKNRGDKKSQDSQDKEDSKSRKRRHSDSETGKDDSKKNKSDDLKPADRTQEHPKDEIKKSDLKGEEDQTKRESDREEKGKKKRTRKKKQQEKKKESKENDLQLRVISKKEWVDLKHQYLNLQKASLAKIKQAWRMGGDASTVKDDSMEAKAIKSSEPEFTPGVVLKIETEKPMESRQQLKDDLQSIAPVAYVDLQPGEQSGFVRCKSPEGATQILNKHGPNEGNNDITVTLLTGEDEEQYWEKLRADRNNKLSSKQKKKKKRGVDRLLCKAEKVSLAGADKGSHVHFDDEDE